ncbi:hypothetical protein COT94_00670 [Candidatus Falkowbacteria bacterium CG10_big_fil_rev_8_21_14_0_10_37_14]|uniref:PDZ domain-containing protein n=1 Tax=Candidatus Falkowbacteria bacterium CG10_big_fil_rev_8_21_14_0_10_37_14 TaxID=1974561 RepID=A0A2M6WUM8_9BACT|nr:S41 family peptidase [Candidatus Falkowbacteria bacterium]PIT96461.1 MAG: hypothetical protein COT94_00670 [Candidatus Falkowbacteria bacterium CG10_big_fil_rev_8_21_14_0_10_37_14]
MIHKKKKASVKDVSSEKDRLSKKRGVGNPRELILGILAVTAVITAFFAGWVLGQPQGDKNLKNQTGIITNSDKSSAFDEQLFWQVWDNLRSTYVDHEQLTDQDIFYGALEGLVASTKDPYTVFMTPSSTKEFNDDMSGSFEGIGAEIGLKDEIITVITPLDEMPAQKAGLKAGDKIIKINGELTTGFSVTEAVKKIRGPKGTVVALTILREGAADTLEIKITRAVIQIKSVKTEWKGDNIIIRVSNFNDDTDSLFATAVNEAITKSAQGIVLDLRNNPGGYLFSAVKMGGYWIKNNTIVIERYANKEQDPHKSSGPATLASIPTVVLVNQGSASAAEIVAGALQDYGLAKLVGAKTFGKGSVQSLMSLPGGSSMKVTSAKWLTPKGRAIDKEGIEPDIKIEFTEKDAKDKNDPQLNKALELLQAK